MRILLPAAVLGACLLHGCSAAPAPAPAPATDRLLVCNKQAASVSIFDAATRQELAVLPTGEGPHEVAVAPDGRTAVVSDYGTQRPGSTLTVIDVVNLRVLRTVELTDPTADGGGEPRQRVFPRPHGSAFVDADHVLVTSEAARQLVLVDLRENRVACTWRTPQTTMHMVALSPDRRRAFATSIREGSVALFDLQDRERTAQRPPAIVATGAGAEGLAVDPATGEVWVGNRAANSVTVLDAAGAVLAELPTGDFPFRIAFADGGASALVTCAESGDVHVFDARTRQLRTAISISADGSELSPMPMGITVDPDSRFGYVACGRGEFVAVIDLRTARVVDRIAARAGPDGIGYARFVR